MREFFGAECFYLLEADLDAGAMGARAFLVVVGLVLLWRGWVMWTERVPSFVLSYRGCSSPPLALPFGGLFMIFLTAGSFQPAWPAFMVIAVGAAGLFSGAVFLLGMFVWYPWFLLPRWYRRARKAGVPRNNLEEMAAFKALPVEEQKRRANPFQ